MEQRGGARMGSGRKPNRYDLQAWRTPQDAELMDTRTRPATPLGMKIHLWGGWQWTAEDGRQYRTNGEGQGLWLWIERDQDWKQQTGTMQFWLPQEREKAIRKLARMEGLKPRTLNNKNDTTRMDKLMQDIANGRQDIDLDEFARLLDLPDGWDWSDVSVGKYDFATVEKAVHNSLR